MNAFLCMFVAVAASFDTRQVSVYFNGTNVTWSSRLDPAAAAMGVFEDSLNVTGWGILNIKTQGRFTDAQQGYAAGFAEGVLTAPRIWEQYLNMWMSIFNNTPDARVQAFGDAQDAWTRQQVAANPKDGFWQQVGHLMGQFDGLRDGFNAVSATKLSTFAFWALNSDGDLFQIIPAVEKHKRPNFETMTSHDIEMFLEAHSRCSALIKVTGNFSNIFMGHSSWYTYQATNRIFKYYEFALSNPRLGSNSVAFASYPGYLESMDDYYIMSGSGLGMVQTSIGFSNASLYDLITPHSLMAWQRVRVANHLAHNGSEWWSVFRTSFSGTYCNTYLVLDFNKFVPGQALVNDLLWIVEEVPGVCAGRDITEYLQLGYWPSYNVPFQPEAVEVSGYRDLVARGVASASFQLAPRAKIFRRDSEKVVDMESFKASLRYNQYKTDPYSEGNACQQICCRGDIANNRAGGCYDTKVTDYQNFWATRSWIVNGPTTDGALLPFSWSQFPNSSHIGLPATYDFDFQMSEPLNWTKFGRQ
jgi:hypothetical protein